MVERITISVHEKLARELRDLAKKEGMSLSKFIAKSLEEFIIQKKKKEAGKKLLKIRLSKEEIDKAFEELRSIRRKERNKWNL